MRKFAVAIAALTALAAPSQAAQWENAATCVATAPGEQPRLTLQSQRRISAEGETSTKVLVLVETATPVLKNRERRSDLSIHVPGQRDFSGLQGVGVETGRVNRITITAPDDPQFLSALSAGETLTIRIPNSEAAELSFSLAGSSSVWSYLAKCLTE